MNIRLIYSNKSNFKKYIKKENLISVNYFDVIEKLSKGDIYKENPSEDIVNVYLYRRLLKAIDNSDDIAYAISNINESIIDSLYNILLKYYSKKYINFELVILKTEEHNE